MTDPAPPVVGLVGLGAMGEPVARRLLAAGYPVVGFDVDPARVAALAAMGGTPASSVGAVARSAATILTLLPSAAALADVAVQVAAASEGKGKGKGKGEGSTGTLVELSTLGLADRQAAQQVLAMAGVGMIDAALSGTAVQAARGDLVVYASGDAASLAACGPVLEAIGRSVHRLGAFGSATITKLIANHLVAVHIAAAAEALQLARRSGLDPAVTLAALVDGAGTSRMLEVRGPMMVDQAYEPASMRVALFMKDIDLIESLAQAVGTATPQFDAAAGLFRATFDDGERDRDTAVVHETVGRYRRPSTGGRR